MKEMLNQLLNFVETLPDMISKIPGSIWTLAVIIFVIMLIIGIVILIKINKFLKNLKNKGTSMIKNISNNNLNKNHEVGSLTENYIEIMKKKGYNNEEINAVISHYMN